ncbi:hypothetical protein CP996_22510 [Escherichia coli]|uniref:Uncharacterized protein n=5 Tax=Escherichia TaxID=561 RepID=A0AAX0PE79_ECOLX|nr:hypothetical protein AC789_145pl01650 [Escherichia coli]EFK66092.1 hypothetical protein HMPREF9347_05064 [Escherichia coli MS 124-1]EFU33066.1 hypothetical protein HMPREF9350_05128 [Escherichia coli MS 85-1]ESA84171.1 hypothetical protein HMPREF1592_00400 [Escherichia coli 907357]ESD46668.1 hypothetical protein HMPREF1604_00001 [Escherichia coli 908519]OYG83434.1 hypothetical protein CI731_10840 [Shigella sonnei]PHK85541.1 hypothetical protein CR083_24315 [Salmonella enterica subsp. enteri
MPFITPSLPRIYTVYNDSDIVTRICRASGMEGGTPLFHMIPPKPDVSRYSRPKVTSLLPPAVIRASAMH